MPSQWQVEYIFLGFNSLEMESDVLYLKVIENCCMKFLKLFLRVLKETLFETLELVKAKKSD